MREAEKQCKPMLEKNKLLNKRNEELTHSIQRQEEKIKGLLKENTEMVRCFKQLVGQQLHAVLLEILTQPCRL